MKYSKPKTAQTNRNATEIMEAQEERIRKFHAHLDECNRCATRCFDLCPVGAKLLASAARQVISVDQAEID